MAERIERVPTAPGIRQFSAGANPTGTVYTVIDCGTPPTGQKWSLTQLAITPLDPYAAPVIAMQAMVLRTVGSYQSGNIPPAGFFGVVAPPAPLPNSLTLATGTVNFALGEHLVVVVQNAPAGLTLIVDYEVHQSPALDYQRPKRRKWWEAALGGLG